MDISVFTGHTLCKEITMARKTHLDAGQFLSKKSQVNEFWNKQKMCQPLRPSCCPERRVLTSCPQQATRSGEDVKENMNSPLSGGNYFLKEIKSTCKSDLEFSCKEELSNFKCG